MATPLVLVCASGLAREVAEVVELLGAHELVGCVDDDRTLWGTRTGRLDVLGGLDLLTGDHSDAALVVCAGKGSTRRLLVERLSGLGVSEDRYATVVHPSADVASSCSLSPGSIVLAQTVMTADVRVADHVVVMPHCTLTHDDVLEDYVTLAAGVSLGGGVRIGQTAYVGMNVSVRERLAVGAGSFLGMGSVVTRDVPCGETWAGVPAVPLSRRRREAVA